MSANAIHNCRYDVAGQSMGDECLKEVWLGKPELNIRT